MLSDLVALRLSGSCGCRRQLPTWCSLAVTGLAPSLPLPAIQVLLCRNPSTGSGSGQTLLLDALGECDISFGFLSLGSSTSLSCRRHKQQAQTSLQHGATAVPFTKEGVLAVNIGDLPVCIKCWQNWKAWMPTYNAELGNPHTGTSIIQSMQNSLKSCSSHLLASCL